MKFLYSFWIFLDAKKKKKNQGFEEKVDTTMNTMETLLEDLVKENPKISSNLEFSNFHQLLNKECQKSLHSNYLLSLLMENRMISFHVVERNF